MKQVLDEIKYLRVARSSIKGEMVKLIHRLAELEEETLRSELRAIIRTERAVGSRDGARAAPEPMIPDKHTHERGSCCAKQVADMVIGKEGDIHPLDNTVAWEGWDAEPDIVGEADQSSGHDTISSPIYDILTSIEDFETPRNRTDIRAFIRVAEMITDIDPDSGHGLHRMHNLLKHGTTWDWN